MTLHYISRGTLSKLSRLVRCYLVHGAGMRPDRLYTGGDFSAKRRSSGPPDSGTQGPIHSDLAAGQNASHGRWKALLCHTTRRTNCFLRRFTAAHFLPLKAASASRELTGKADS